MLFFFQCYLPMALIRTSVKRLHYSVNVIAQCVCWYLAYSLSLRDLEEMMAGIGITETKAHPIRELKIQH